jgi:hypothetical protein
MPRIPETFNIGQTSTITPEVLLELLQRMYTDLATAINQKPDLVQRTTDGQASDFFLDQGTININLSTDKVEMLTNHPTQTTVTWTQLS